MTGEGTIPLPQDPSELFAGPLTPDAAVQVEATMHRVAGSTVPDPNDLVALDALAGTVHAEEVFVDSGQATGDEVVLEAQTVYSRTTTGTDGKPHVEEIDPMVGKALADYVQWRQGGVEAESSPQDSPSWAAAPKPQTNTAGKEHLPLTPEEEQIDALLRAMHPGKGNPRTISLADKARLDELAESVERTETPDGKGGVDYGYERVEKQPDGAVVRTPLQKGLGARLYGHNKAAQAAKERAASKKSQPPHTPPKPHQPPVEEEEPGPEDDSNDTNPPESAEEILHRLERNLGLGGETDQEKPTVDIKYGLAETRQRCNDAVLLKQHLLRRPLMTGPNGSTIRTSNVQVNHLFGAFNTLPTATKSGRSPAPAAEEAVRLYLDEREPHSLDEAVQNMWGAMDWASRSTARHGERNNAEATVGHVIEVDGKQYLIAARSGNGCMAISRGEVFADVFDGEDIAQRQSHPERDTEVVVRELQPGDKILMGSAGIFRDGDIPRRGMRDLFELENPQRAAEAFLARFGLEGHDSNDFREKVATMVVVGDVSQLDPNAQLPLTPIGPAIFDRPEMGRGLLTDEQLGDFGREDIDGGERRQAPTRAERGRSAARLALQQLITGHPVRAVDWPKKELQADRQARQRSRHASVLPGSSKPSTAPRGVPQWVLDEITRRGY